MLAFGSWGPESDAVLSVCVSAYCGLKFWLSHFFGLGEERKELSRKHGNEP